MLVYQIGIDVSYLMGHTRASEHCPNIFYQALEETIILAVDTRDKVSKFDAYKDVPCAASPFIQATCKPAWMNPERDSDYRTSTEAAMESIWGLRAKISIGGRKPEIYEISVSEQ